MFPSLLRFKSISLKHQPYRRHPGRTDRLRIPGCSPGLVRLLWVPDSHRVLKPYTGLTPEEDDIYRINKDGRDLSDKTGPVCIRAKWPIRLELIQVSAA